MTGFKQKYDLDLKDNSQRILRFFDSNASLRSMLQELLTNNCKVSWAKDLKEHMDQFSNRVLKYKFDKLNQRIAVIHVIEDKQIDKNADKDIRQMQREIISDRIELRDELEDYVDSLSDKGRENFIQKANKLASFFGIKELSQCILKESKKAEREWRLAVDYVEAIQSGEEPWQLDAILCYLDKYKKSSMEAKGKYAKKLYGDIVKRFELVLGHPKVNLEKVEDQISTLSISEVKENANKVAAFKQLRYMHQCAIDAINSADKFFYDVWI